LPGGGVIVVNSKPRLAAGRNPPLMLMRDGHSALLGDWFSLILTRLFEFVSVAPL
jgi:hypothetical protein